MKTFVTWSSTSNWGEKNRTNQIRVNKKRKKRKEPISELGTLRHLSIFLKFFKIWWNYLVSNSCYQCTSTLFDAYLIILYSKFLRGSTNFPGCVNFTRRAMLIAKKFCQFLRLSAFIVTLLLPQQVYAAQFQLRRRELVSLQWYDIKASTGVYYVNWIDVLLLTLVIFLSVCFCFCASRVGCYTFCCPKPTSTSDERRNLL